MKPELTFLHPTGDTMEPQDGRKEAISRLLEDIRLLSEKNKDRLPLHGDVSFLHTNDNGLAENVAQLPELAKTLEPDPAHPVRVALVVGMGGVLSMLPEIPADLVLIVDYDSRLGAWVASSVQALKEENDPDAFEGRMYSSGHARLDGDLLAEKRRLELEPFDESTSLHFLGNPARYEMSRAALKTKQIGFCCLDLTDQASVQALSDIFRTYGAVISFANFTNVHEHVGRMHLTHDFERGARQLPFVKNAIIFSSQKAGGTPDQVLPPQRGIEEYLRSI